MNASSHALSVQIQSLASLLSATAILSCLAVIFADNTLGAEEASAFSALVSGVKVDGSSDSTVAIQRSLDETAKTGGSVHLPPGRYLVKGSLHIAPGVTLQGVMESPVWSEPLKGSIILATGGRGHDFDCKVNHVVIGQHRELLGCLRCLSPSTSSTSYSPPELVALRDQPSPHRHVLRLRNWC